MSPTINIWNSFAESFAESALNGVFLGVGVAIVVAVVMRGLRRMNAAARFGIWCAALLCVVGLMAASDGGPSRADQVVADAARTPPELSAALEESAEKVADPSPPVASPIVAPDVPLIAKAEPAMAPVAARVASVSRPEARGVFEIHRGPWLGIVALGWVLFSVFFLSRILWSWIGLCRLKRNAREMPADVAARLTSLTEGEGNAAPATVATSKQIAVPIAVGLTRPMIIFPDGLRERLTDDEFDQIYLHELAHLERRDDWTNLFQQLSRALFFFHPAVHWICRQLDFEREIACDNWVIETTGKARSYAACLTRLAELTQTLGRPPLATGAWMTRKQLTRRITMLLNSRRNVSARHSWSGFLCAGALITATAIFALPSFTLVAVGAPDDDKHKPRTRERDRDRERDRNTDAREREERRRLRPTENGERELRERQTSVRRAKFMEAANAKRQAQVREFDERVERAQAELNEVKAQHRRGEASAKSVEQHEMSLKELRAIRNRVAEGSRIPIEWGSDLQREPRGEQAKLIEQQIGLIDEQLRIQRLRVEAGAAHGEAPYELQMQRLQLQRELIQYQGHNGERAVAEERDLIQQQIVLTARLVERATERSKFMDSEAPSFEVRMRLLQLKRELVAATPRANPPRPWARNMPVENPRGAVRSRRPQTGELPPRDAAWGGREVQFGQPQPADAAPVDRGFSGFESKKVSERQIVDRKRREEAVATFKPSATMPDSATDDISVVERKLDDAVASPDQRRASTSPAGRLAHPVDRRRGGEDRLRPANTPSDEKLAATEYEDLAARNMKEAARQRTLAEQYAKEAMEQQKLAQVNEARAIQAAKKAASAHDQLAIETAKLKQMLEEERERREALERKLKELYEKAEKSAKSKEKADVNLKKKKSVDPF